jgi:3-hydroxybutyryl-CoA dehydrogenase
MTVHFRLIDSGNSRSFMPGDPLFATADDEGEALIIIGSDAGSRLHSLSDEVRSAARVVLVELGSECLGTHTGEAMGAEGSNIIGFARFRLGDAAPTQLVELVHQPATGGDAIEAATALFTALGLAVALCRDTPGRILDRLMRPYFNAALTRLDDGLASAAEIDKALRLGLGYPKGPIELLRETGLEHHHDVSAALDQMLDAPGFVPARRAQIAAARRNFQIDQKKSRP